MSRASKLSKPVQEFIRICESLISDGPGAGLSENDIRAVRLYARLLDTRFPSTDDKASKYDVVVDPPPSPSGYVGDTVPHGIKVLMIDGEEDHEYWVQRLRVCSPEYQINEATSGSFGLELFRSLSFDCVVLELVLPDMSGFEALINLAPSAAQPRGHCSHQQLSPGNTPAGEEQRSPCLFGQAVHVRRRLGSSHSESHRRCRATPQRNPR